MGTACSPETKIFSFWKNLEGWKMMNLIFYGPYTYLAKQATRLKLFGITNLVEKITFKLLFQGPLAK